MNVLHVPAREVSLFRNRQQGERKRAKNCPPCPPYQTSPFSDDDEISSTTGSCVEGKYPPFLLYLCVALHHVLPPNLSLSLLVGLLDDTRQLLQLGALMQGDVLPGHDLFLHLGHLVAERLLVLVDIVVVEVLLHLKVRTRKR